VTDEGVALCTIAGTPGMYRSYHIFLMLLKLNYYFFEVFAIQFLVLVLKPNDVEYALTIIGIIIALPIVIFAIYAVRAKALPLLARPADGWLTATAASRASSHAAHRSGWRSFGWSRSG